MIFKKYADAWAKADINVLRSLLADDAEILMHSTGHSMSADEWRDRIGSRIHELKQENLRCVYENEDILVMHFIMNFPNGTRDAVMYVAMKENEKIKRIETGSTPLITK